MFRLFAIVVAVVLIGWPLYSIYAMTVPVPQFRTDGYVDFVTFAGAVVAVYGGVVLGVAVRSARAGRAWLRLRPVEVLKAGVAGPLAVGVVFVIGAGVRGVMTQGSFEKGIGTLWGLFLIFPALFGAIVSGGLALLIWGLRSDRS